MGRKRHQDVEYVFIHIPKTAGTSFKDEIEKIRKIEFQGHEVLFRYVKGLKEIIVLRDPIDRFTSAFFYIKKSSKTKSDLYETPEELIQDLIKFSPDGYRFIRDTRDVNGVKTFTNWVFHPQIGWVDDPHRVLLFENLNQEVDMLNKELNISIDLPKKNASERNEFEYSEKSIEYLKVIYKEDFKLYDEISKYEYNKRNHELKQGLIKKII